MEKVNDIRHGRHCVFHLHVHLVFVTKYRYGVFTREILDDLKEIFSSVCSDFEAELVEFDGEEDHVHLLVVYPPKVAISSLQATLQAVAVERRSPSLSSILNPKELPTKGKLAKLGAPYILPLKGEVLRRA